MDFQVFYTDPFLIKGLDFLSCTEVLHCRECSNLMKPDMRYSRVEYIDYESGEPVKKSMAAAYRATVFECGAVGCQEYKKILYKSLCWVWL